MVDKKEVDLVVVVTPHRGDRTVRWYLDEFSAAFGAEIISASLMGVRTYRYLHEIPPHVLHTAQMVYETLKDPHGDRRWVDMLATHTVVAGKAVPVADAKKAVTDQDGDKNGG